MEIMKSKATFDISTCTHLLCLLAFINTSPLSAQERDIFFDMPIVLSANRLEQPISSAAVSITVIDRETIIASGARTIPEVLRLVPGMQVGYSGNERGDEPAYVVSYHGHSGQYSRQMQVLIDGRSIYEPFRGGINWKSIPVNINDIERIEVSRGPNLASYGSNSFQAAINIITRTAAEDQGSFIQTNIGSNHIRDLTYRYGGNTGNLDYRITASTLNDAGLDSANEFDYPDDAESNNVDYRLDYQLDNKNTVSYQGGYGVNRQQTDRNHSFSEALGTVSPYPLDRTVENTHFFQFIKWESNINKENTLLVQYYYNLSDKEDKSLSDQIVYTDSIPNDFLPAPAPAILDIQTDPFTLDINGDVRSERHNLELTHFITPNQDVKFSWGASAQTDIVHAPFYLGTEDKIKHHQFRGFANIEWHVNQNNIINAGALGEKNDVTDNELSPRLSVTHFFNKDHSLRIGISQATRSPFVFETDADTYLKKDNVNVNVTNLPIPFSFPYNLYLQYWLGSIPGQVDLKNEKIISREIAYYGSFLDSALLFNARLFHDDIYDLIDTRNVDISALRTQANVSTTAEVIQNTVDSTTTGIELEMDYRINPDLRLIVSGAVINIDSVDDDIEISAPQHSFSFITMNRFNNKYSGSLAYYYVDAFSWTDSTGGTSEYQTMDLRLSRTLKFDKANASLSIVLKNLLGDYSDYHEFPTTNSVNNPAVVHSKLAYIDFRMNF